MIDPLPTLAQPLYDWYLQASSDAFRQSAVESRKARYEMSHDLAGAAFVQMAVAFGDAAQAIEPTAKEFPT